MPSHSQLLPVMLLLFAVATTLLVMARTLPAQNVISVASIIALISGVMQVIGTEFGTPFGHYFYMQNAGPRIFHVLPWTIPLIWIVVILNSRGVARLVLRSWRESPNVGYYTIGLTCVLTVLLDAALEPYAELNRYWVWRTPAVVPSWHGVPWTNFFGWAVTTLLILTCATPWLINKKTIKEPPQDFYAPIIWGLLVLFLVVSDLRGV